MKQLRAQAYIDAITWFDEAYCQDGQLNDIMENAQYLKLKSKITEIIPQAQNLYQRLKLISSRILKMMDMIKKENYKHYLSQLHDLQEINLIRKRVLDSKFFEQWKQVGLYFKIHPNERITLLVNGFMLHLPLDIKDYLKEKCGVYQRNSVRLPN